MADNEIFTASAMRRYARETLEEWVKGYTDPYSDRRQRRIEVVDVDDDWIIVRVQRMGLHGGYDRKVKHYKIAIEVKEVESEPANNPAPQGG